MAKAIKCSDIGYDCGWEAKAGTEDELLGKVVEHAKADHGMETITPEVVEKVKSVIRDI
jgi:predicted small metal-binding protein